MSAFSGRLSSPKGTERSQPTRHVVGIPLFKAKVDSPAGSPPKRTGLMHAESRRDMSGSPSKGDAVRSAADQSFRKVVATLAHLDSRRHIPSSPTKADTSPTVKTRSKSPMAPSMLEAQASNQSWRGLLRQPTTVGIGDLEGSHNDSGLPGRTRSHWFKEDSYTAESLGHAAKRRTKTSIGLGSNREMYISQCTAAGVFPIPEFTGTLSEERSKFDLREIRLPGKHISTLVPFLDLIKANKSIRVLDFSDNPFSTEELLLLMEIIQEHPRCRDLYIIRCPNIKWSVSTLEQLHLLERKKRDLNVHLHGEVQSYFELAAESGLDPMLSVPAVEENILLVVDQDPQMAKAVGDSNLLGIVKQGLHLFIHTKKEMNRNHGFCLCGFTQKAKDFSPFELSFESSVLALAPKIDSLVVMMEHKTEKHANPDDDGPDFTSVLEILEEKMEECRSTHPKHPAIFRIIFIYGRSKRLPRLLDNGTTRRVLGYPNLFLDMVYLHEEVTEEQHQHMQKVFHRLVEIAMKCKGSAYVLNCCMRPQTAQRTFNAALATLLCHPLQRPFHQTKFKAELGPHGGRQQTDGRKVYRYLKLRYPPHSTLGAKLSSITAEWREFTEEELLYEQRDASLYLNPAKREVKKKLHRVVDTIALNINPALICAICTDLVNTPVVGSHCQHVFCQMCLLSGNQTHCPECRQRLERSVVREPSPELRKLLESVTVPCSYGCGKHMKEFERTAHHKICHKALVDCASPSCTWYGRREEYMAHWLTCRGRFVRCLGCDSPVSLALFQDHSSRCRSTCDRCGTEVSPAYMHWHVTNECPHNLIRCPYAELGCGYYVTAANERSMQLHLHDDCLIGRAMNAITQCSEELNAICLSAREQSSFLQHSIEKLEQSVSIDLATQCLRQPYEVLTLRKRLLEAFISLFGCPLEYSTEYKYIAFVFNTDSTPPSPFVVTCILPDDFPNVPPEIVLYSFVYSYMEEDLLYPVSLDIDVQYDMKWHVDMLADSIRGQIINQAGLLERLNRDREASIRVRPYV